MSFSKLAGLRLTDIQLESGVDVIPCNFHTAVRHLFRIEPLFPNQTLDIKNCIFEIELFGLR